MPKTATAKIRVDLSAVELEALIKLAEDQLFRVKFIDPKMPGHRKDPEQVRAAESAVSTLRESLPKVGFKTDPSQIHIPTKEKVL
jgi:hypothetical protein